VVTGFETLNIKANPGPTAATAANMLTTISAITGSTLSKVNLTGSAVAITDAALTVAATFDASALTGNNNATIAGVSTSGLTLGGNLVAGSIVTGSNFIDTITLGTVGSTYNLGAGNDSISGTLAQYRTATTYNTIDAGSGTDTANITGGATLTMVDDDFKGLTNIEKITIATTGANSQSITTGGWFDANFKAAGVTLTSTTSTGNITLAAGSFTGNMTVVATTVGTTAGEGGINITTGTGNDKITVTNATAGDNSVINTGAGNDTIIGGADADSITGGAGADTLTGNGGIDTFVIAADGGDTITDFVSATDLLNFAAYTNGIVKSYGAYSTTSTDISVDNNVIVYTTSGITIAAAAAAIAADATVTGTKGLIVISDAANTYIYGTDNLANDGTETLLLTLTGVTSVVTADFNTL
jgi:hypothetical protein